MRHWWTIPLIAFAATRLPTLLIAWFVVQARPGLSVGDVLTNWDGNWYQIVADQGYVELAPGGIVTHPFMTLAFFPVVPLSARWLDAATGIGPAMAGVVISLVAAAAASVLLWRLVHRRYGQEVATASLVLLLLSPHGFVLSMFYTEGVALLFVVLTFTFLEDRMWVLAGLAAMFGGLVRPNGFLLVVPCLVAAWLAVRERPSWRPWVAPALAPLGFVAWIGYAWYRTGSLFGYFEIQRDGWGAGLDAGRESMTGIWNALTFGWGTPDEVGNTLLLVLVGVLGVAFAIRSKLGAVWISYAVALTVLTYANERQASSARFLITAFPLAVGWVMVAGQRWRGLVIGVSATMMGALYMMSSLTLLYTP